MIATSTDLREHKGRPPSLWRFHTERQDASSLARAGWFDTPHGRVQTPVFMPVGTQATVKSVLPSELTAAGAQVVLANAYHLARRPGAAGIAALGGIHALMGWSGPILTDSGGFQVFSLAGGKNGSPSLIDRVSEDGVTLKGNGSSAVTITPESSMEGQRLIGADMIMAFDECLSDSASHEEARTSMERTHRWLVRCQQAWKRHPRSSVGTEQGLFGIAQGGVYRELRRASAEFVGQHDLAGFAIGGESIGFSKTNTLTVLESLSDLLPTSRPRYAMGVGEPDDFVEVVARGIDMFDCVLPTRLARNGTVYTRSGRLRLPARDCANDGDPIDRSCPCWTCRSFSRGYLRYLFKAREPLGPRLASVHNVAFCCHVVDEMRRSILAGEFSSYWAEFLRSYRQMDVSGSPIV